FRLLVGGVSPQLGAGAGLQSLPASGVLPAIAVADAAPPPAPTSPYLSVLWRPVEPRGMPGAVPYQARRSETCYVDAPWPPQTSPLGFLIRCTPLVQPICQ